MKTQKELESLKEEMAQLKSKLVELTDEELAVVTGSFPQRGIGYNQSGLPDEDVKVVFTPPFNQTYLHLTGQSD